MKKAKLPYDTSALSQWMSTTSGLSIEVTWGPASLLISAKDPKHHDTCIYGYTLPHSIIAKAKVPKELYTKVMKDLIQCFKVHVKQCKKGKKSKPSVEGFVWSGDTGVVTTNDVLAAFTTTYHGLKAAAETDDSQRPGFEESP